MKIPGRPAVTLLTLSTDSEYFSEGRLVYLGNALIGYRPDDGSSEEEIVAEVTEKLALMLRERFEWKTSP
jgi:hypothetical protein